VQLGRSIQNVREYFNPGLGLAGFVFTMSEPTINSATSLKILRQTYTDDVLNTVIPKNVDIREAHFKQQDIFAYNPSSKSARAYGNLIKEIYGI
jgi:chromosome partitioning protein